MHEHTKYINLCTHDSRGNKRGAKEIEKFDRKSKEDGPKDRMEC